MNSKPNSQHQRGVGPGSRFSLWYVLAAIGLMLVAQNALFARPFEQVSYSDFKADLRAGRIAEVRIGTQVIRGTLHMPDDASEMTPLRFMTVRVEDPDLVKELEAYEVKYTGQNDNNLLKTVLSWVLPLGLLFLLWGFLARRLGPGQGVMNFGKSRARIYAERETGSTFADVAGADEAKEELQEIIDFLRNPQKYANLGGRIPKGVLLVGPPGTGKTLLSRAVAGEASVPFFQPQRLGLCGNVRRRRRSAGTRPVQASAGESAVHRFHRRIGRGWQSARHQPHAAERRARADAEPAAGRDGRF